MQASSNRNFEFLLDRAVALAASGNLRTEICCARARLLETLWKTILTVAYRRMLVPPETISLPVG
jgi:hypothetical protein